MLKEKMLVPQLRFSEFEGEWKINKLGQIAKFFKGKGISKNDIINDGENECIRYGELYTTYNEVIDSIASKTNIALDVSVLSNENDVIIPSSGETQLDIVTASCVLKKGVILGGDLNIIRTNLNGVFLSYLLNNRKKKDIAKLSQGNSVVHLYNKQLATLNLNLPTPKEQQKIANFLSALDNRIQTLVKKKTLLEQYKKGVIQKIFKQELRFKDDDGNAFADWEKRRFSDVLFEHKLKSTGKEQVHSVSVHKGVINQIEHLGRSFSAKNTDHYSRALPNDIIYTKSPTGDFPLGIIKQNHIKEDVIISPLYGVFTPETKELGYILHVYFESPINTSNYLSSIIQKGAKNTINITNNTFLSKKMLLPVFKKEQTKIANFLSTIDKNIALVTKKIEHTKTYKKGLLQQMFV
jgi:type I restriction enzyme S subunit